MLVDSLKVFCDLTETQSFSKTAVLNSVTQSAVSQQLKSIEKRQGRQLLERNKRSLTLTAEGEIFYNYARDIVRQFEEMQHQIQALGGEVTGTVKLSAIYSVGMFELAPHLKAYFKAYPNVNLRLSYDESKKIYTDVANSQVDLGVVAFPKSQRNVEIIQYKEDEMVVACNPENEIAKHDALEPKLLDKQPLVLFTPETPTRQAIDRFFRKHGVRPEVVMELDRIATIKHAVEVDIGIAIVPAPSLEQETARRIIKAIPFEGDILDRPVGILYRRGRRLSLAAQRLIETLVEQEGTTLPTVSPKLEMASND